MPVHATEARWDAEPGPALLETTVGDLLDARAAAHPDRPFIVCRDDDAGMRVQWTLAEFQAEVDAFAKGLIALGIAPGDKVGILAANRPEWLIADFALPKIGAVLVTVNTHSRQGELAHILAQAEMKALILQRGHRGNPFLDHVRALLPDLRANERFPHFAHAILVGEPGVDEPGTVGFDRILAAGRQLDAAALRARQAAVTPRDIWQIQFTSGTTGAPKGATLTHHGTLNNAFIFGRAAGMREGDRLASSMPLFHTAANIMELLGVLVHGATLVKAAAFEPAQMLQLVHEEKPTILCAVPTMMIAMWNHPRFAAGEFDVRSVRLAIGGGVPYPVAVLRKIREVFGAEVQLGFGMTELSPMVTCTAADDPLEHKAVCVGRPLPHIDVKVQRPDGSVCAHGEPGELLVRGFGVTPGYYRAPEATAKTIDADGFLHSGDLATMDADGSVRIVGRLKDMIKRGGENVYPAEVENFLMQHPKIAQAQVVGVPDDYMGEEAAAFVQLRPGQALTVDEIREHCRAHMARHKLPKYFRFVDAYPLTGSGKVQKFALREMMVKELQQQAKDAG